MAAGVRLIVSSRRRRISGTNVRRRSGGGRLVRIVMTVLCVLWTIPTVGALLSSFRPGGDVNTSGWWTLLLRPSEFSHLTVAGYRQALFGQAHMAQAALNSIAITVPATVVPLLLSAFCAYALVFMRFRGKALVFSTLIWMLVVPYQVAILPLLKLYTSIGIQGTYPTVWLALTAFAVPLQTYLLRGYLLQLPVEIIDSARVDGASHWRVFWRIVVPLSAPAITGLAVFQFLTAWNDLFLALVFIGQGPNNPLPVALATYVGGFGQLTAAGIITVIAPVTVYLVIQRYFAGELAFVATAGR